VIDSKNQPRTMFKLDGWNRKKQKYENVNYEEFRVGILVNKK
jgi:hypothetical protein